MLYCKKLKCSMLLSACQVRKDEARKISGIPLKVLLKELPDDYPYNIFMLLKCDRCQEQLEECKAFIDAAHADRG